MAGASLAAKLVRAGGGFQAHAMPAEMIGQLQVLDVADVWSARFDVLAARDELLARFAGTYWCYVNYQSPLVTKVQLRAREVE